MTSKVESNESSTETKSTEEPKSKALTPAERKALRAEIKKNKELLAQDRQSRPKRKLTEKQLNALAEGRKKNPKLKPKEQN